jgi:hypothetical protein
MKVLVFLVLTFAGSPVHAAYPTAPKKAPLEAQVYDTPVKLTKAPVNTYAPTKAPSYEYPPAAAPAYAPTTYTDPTAYTPNPPPSSINQPKRKCGILRGRKMCAFTKCGYVGRWFGWCKDK